jgi:multicomponent Na+:H+ antiporter subunit E
LRLLVLTLFMGVFWYILSGHTEPLIIGFAVVSIAIVLVVASRMRVVDREGFPYQIVFRAISYSVWLGVQILLSSVAVAKLIVSPKLSISPRMIEVPCGQASDLGRAIYANSITATPGTVTINVWQDRMVVHALNAASADDLATGEMERRVRHVEEGRS